MRYLEGIWKVSRDFGSCKMLKFSLTNLFDPNFVLAPKFFKTNILWPKMCLDQKILNQYLSFVEQNFLDPTFLKKKNWTNNIFRQKKFSDLNFLDFFHFLGHFLIR